MLPFFYCLFLHIYYNIIKNLTFPNIWIKKCCNCGFCYVDLAKYSFIAVLIHFFVKLFAYMDFFLYLCSEFKNNEKTMIASDLESLLKEHFGCKNNPFRKVDGK